MELIRTAARNRAIALLECGVAAASLGTWSFSIVLTIYAYREGGANAVGLALMARMLPAALAAPFTGLLADRWPRRTVIMISTAARALALLAIAACVQSGAPFVAVIALGGIFTIFETLHRPSMAALLPHHARTPAELAAGNVLWTTADYAGFLAGSLLAGTLVGLAGLPAALLVCVAAFVVASATTFALPADTRPPALPDHAVRGVASQLLEGVRTIAAHGELQLVTGLSAVAILTEGMLDVLLVVAAIELLDMGDSGVGWLNAAWGVGGLVSGALAVVLIGRGRLVSSLVFAAVVAGGCIALVGLFAQPAATLALLVAFGLSYGLLEGALPMLTQRLVADDVLARVFAVREALSVLAFALAAVLAAGLVSLLGGRGALFAAATVLPLAGVVLRRRLGRLDAGLKAPEELFLLLRALPMFAPLPVAAIENLALRVEIEHHDSGTKVIAQGDVGDRFYVIAEGEVEVHEDGVLRRVERRGECFGEIALLRDVTRTATVTATTPLRLLSLRRDDFLAAIGAHLRSAHEAQTIAAERLPVTAPPPHQTVGS